VKEWVKQASGGRVVFATADIGMSVFLGCLRGAAWLHQTHHWQTAGTSFYADHLLFDRLYNDSLPFVDRLAERLVGTYGPQFVAASEQAQILSNTLKEPPSSSGIAGGTAEGMVAASLAMELKLLSYLDSVYADMQAQNALSQGTDNLLQEIADKHEEFTYLLKQRSRTGS
jgi:DNA-binding ferritin-like protein